MGGGVGGGGQCVENSADDVSAGFSIRCPYMCQDLCRMPDASPPPVCTSTAPACRMCALACLAWLTRMCVAAMAVWQDTSVRIADGPSLELVDRADDTK